MMTRTVCFLFFLLLSSCGSSSPQQAGTEPVSHEIFDQLLKRNVTPEGWVRYEGFDKDRAELKKYLDLLQKNAPNDAWSESEKLAYWINAYNAFTIELVLQHYPVESIKDIGSKIQIPFVNTPWDIKFIKIGGNELDLNNIEHSILRKEFDEPRIHFAINCASYSCPVLRNEAYTAGKLEEQLEEQAFAFINDPRRNDISSSSARLSKIFDWFSGDFTKKRALWEYLNQYANTPLNETTKIEYLEYDWALNDARNF